jgi:hypothetical protein
LFLLSGIGIAAQPVRERLPARELTDVVEPIIEGESCRLSERDVFRTWACQVEPTTCGKLA